MSTRNCNDPSVFSKPLPAPSLNGHVPSHEEYADYMRVVASHATVNFWLLRYDHVCYLEGDGSAALVLAHLINLLRLKHDNEEDRRRLRRDMLWFRCPVKDVTVKLNASKHKVPRCLATLEAAEIIETDHRAGNVLWVRVSAEKLAEIEGWYLRFVEDGGQKPGKRVSGNPESGSQKPGKRVSHTTNNPTKNLPPTGEHPPAAALLVNGVPKPANRVNAVPPTGPAAKQEKKYTPFCYEAQAEFRKLLQRNGHPPTYGRRSTGWTAEEGAHWIDSLLNYLGGNEARLLATLRHYPERADVVEGNGGPSKVYSIKTFCHPEMFLALERCRKEDEKSRGEYTPYTTEVHGRVRISRLVQE